MARMNFAPVSGAPSTRLQFASGYFMLTGAFVLVLIVIALVGAIWSPELAALLTAHPVRAAVATTVNIAFACGLFWIGVAIGRAVRKAALLGIGAFALALVPPIHEFSAIISVIGIIILVSIWNELH